MATVSERHGDLISAEADPGYEMVLDISPQLRSLLGRLAAESGGTEFDVIGKAISLYDVAMAARRAGKRLGIFGEDLEMDQEILGF